MDFLSNQWTNQLQHASDQIIDLYRLSFKRVRSTELYKAPDERCSFLRCCGNGLQACARGLWNTAVR